MYFDSKGISFEFIFKTQIRILEARRPKFEILDARRLKIVILNVQFSLSSQVYFSKKLYL